MTPPEALRACPQGTPLADRQCRIRGGSVAGPSHDRSIVRGPVEVLA